MKSKKIKFFLVLVIIFLIFFSLNKLGINSARNAILLISSPFQQAFWQAGEKVSFGFQALFGAGDFKRENQELKKTNLRLLEEITNFKEVARENMSLRKALNLGLEKEFNLVLAKAISKKTEGDFILVNRGKEDGISKDMPVISSEKILLGKVGEVFDNFSTIILISNSKVTFDIEVLSENPSATESLNRALGAAKGEGNSKLIFQFIPKEAQIKEGDIVTTSALGGNFPQGLLVGTINTLEKNDIEPFQQGEIKPYFLEIDLTNLFIIK